MFLNYSGKRKLFLFLLLGLILSDCSKDSGQESKEKAKSKLVVSYGNNIYLMDEDGSNRQKITDGSWPSLSPDRKKIVYVGSKIGKYSEGVAEEKTIYIFDLETKEKREIEWGESPSWSPDGKRIAYTGIFEGDDGYSLKTINADGTGVTRITSASESIGNPKWSPDGKYLLFDTSSGESSEIAAGSGFYRVKSDGSELDWSKHTEISVGDQPVYSPDGKKIAFCRRLEGGYALWLYDVEIKKEKELLPPDRFRAEIAWSPDGKKIAQITKRYEGKWDWDKGVELQIVDSENGDVLKVIPFQKYVQGIDWK